MSRFHLWVLLFFSLLGVIFLHRAIIGQDLALPGDILIGHYYPWRDYVWDGRDSGYPVKNFDLSDATNAFFPWRKFTVDQLSNGIIPFRNPYNFLGTPHMANISAAVFYPLSVIFYLMPFFAAWDIFILLQIILAGFFMYLYLENLKLGRAVAIYGGGVFALSSYMMTTLEYSVIGHTVLWTPLILYSIDKLLETKKIKFLSLGVIAGTFLFLAGFIQVALYVYALALLYFLFRAQKKDYRYLGIFVFPPLFSLFQLLPFYEVAQRSSRIEGYFAGFSDAKKYLMPFERLIGGLIPDYFGNPAKWNFVNEISYTEFAFYVGIPVIIFAIFSLGFARKNNNVKFWALITLGALIFFSANPVSKFIHSLNIPFYSTFLPSRLLSILTIGLIVLSSYGLHFFRTSLVKKIKTRLSLTRILILVLVIFAYFSIAAWASLGEDPAKAMVSLRNTAFSIFIFIVVSASIVLVRSFHKKYALKAFFVWIVFISLFTFWDLIRAGWQYNSFINESLVFPKTKSLEYLEDLDIAPRVVMSHQELLPAEANMYYDFALIGGYDTVHAAKTERLINTLNYGSENIDRVSGRVVFVSSLTSDRYDILAPEYYYILEDAGQPRKNMELVLSDGRASLFKNNGAFPRAFFAQEIEKVAPDQVLAKTLELANSRLRKAVVDRSLSVEGINQGLVEVVSDQGNEIVIDIRAPEAGLVVVSQAYDKSWKAINASTNEEIKLLEVNYQLIGFIAPKGDYAVKFVYAPESFYLGVKIAIASLVLFALYLRELRPQRGILAVSDTKRNRS